MEKITSVTNPKVKNIKKLLVKSKERKAQGLFVFEGARELSLAIAGGYKIQSVYVDRVLFEKSDYKDVLSKIEQKKITEISNNVFSSLAYREDSDGIITVAHTKENKLEDIKDPNPFIIILEGVEKPGNLGAILRTADAAAVSALVVCDIATDVFNPNVIRSSVGCLFTVPLIVCRSEDILSFTEDNNIQTLAAQLHTDKWYHDVDYKKPTAIVMGTEADGLTNFWIKNASQSIKIPMRGEIDSLNVSVSTAIITFEAMRQRGF